ncbi:rRNA maturation RNAse YbeY, partial [bacterium]|nr:rRNA maturation RNAse YbeY [bacterium]
MAPDMLYTTSTLRKRRIPNLPFGDIKNAVLGTRYELSLVFVGDILSRKLNLRYRNKNKAANILSFPLD